MLAVGRLGDFTGPAALRAGVNAKLPIGGILFGPMFASAIVVPIASSSTCDFCALQLAVFSRSRPRTASLCSTSMSVVVSFELCFILPKRLFGFRAKSLDQKLWSGVTNTVEEA